MKKMIAGGIITVLTIGIAGCSWFQPAEPTVEQPDAETTTDVTEPSDEPATEKETDATVSTLCTDPPTTTEIGRDVYPIDPKYNN